MENLFKQMETKVLKRYLSVLNLLIEASKREFDPIPVADHPNAFLPTPGFRPLRTRDVDQLAREVLRTLIQEELKQRQENE